MSNTELEDLLRSELRAEVTGIELPRHVYDNATRRHQRRRVATQVAGVAAGAVLVAVGVVAATSPLADPGRGATLAGPARDTTPSGTATAGPRLETVADIRPRVERALDANHAIIRTTAHDTLTAWAPPGAGHKATKTGADGTDSNATPPPLRETNDNWFDPETGYITCYVHMNGELTSVSRFPQKKRGTDTSVHFPTRTWMVEHVAARQLPKITVGKVGEPLLDSVAGIRAAVERPDIRIVGHQRIHGRDATHLRFSVTKGAETVTGDAWFDSTTYVPLRATTSYGSGPGSLAITTRFLPRTAVNLARTKLRIPAGFHQVQPPSK
ncbi:MAG: hypothetical protein WCA46_25025 [Actinocatenispora sp.]